MFENEESSIMISPVVAAEINPQVSKNLKTPFKKITKSIAKVLNSRMSSQSR
jgi:hypothetical protein